jgi:single-strand DNA-binding protein
MSDINVVVLVGRLTRDCELKYTTSGMPVCRFSLVINRRKKQGEQWVDEPNFFDVDFWGKGGETISGYLLKGRQVGIEGELRQDRWEQDGQSRSKVMINATNVRLLGSPPGGGNSGGSEGEAATGYAGSGRARQVKAENGQMPTPGNGAESTKAPAVEEFPDDIPF